MKALRLLASFLMVATVPGVFVLVGTQAHVEGSAGGSWMLGAVAAVLWVIGWFAFFAAWFGFHSLLWPND